MQTNARAKLRTIKRSLLHWWRRPRTENYQIEKTILLASSGRSGSTWLAAILLNNRNLRYMFEPFHPGWVSAFQSSETRLYLSHSEPASSGEASAIKDVLSGRLSNPWIDQYNTCHCVDRRLIKTIRANLLLPWIRSQFPTIKLIFLVRNPMDQAMSAVVGQWYETKSDSLSFVSRAKGLRRYQPLIEQTNQFAKTPFTCGIRFWCLENLVVLNELTQTDVQFVYYEDVVNDPGNTIRSLLGSLDLEIDDRWQHLHSKPSRTSRTKKNRSSRVNISKDEIAVAETIIEHFSLSHLYEHGKNPKARAGKQFLTGTY